MPAFGQIMPKLYFGSYPESIRDNWGTILNVSDTPCDSLTPKSLFYKTPNHFWVPVAEWGEFPYSAFYAVMKILDQALQRGDVTLIHCHGGICRSQLMGFAYLVYRFKQEADNIWPKGVSQWRNFLDGHLVSKPPRFLLDFLQLISEYPTYSVDGIKGKIWSKYKINP